MPINLTAAFQQLCNIQVLRTNVSPPDTKPLAYAKFQEADTVLWQDPANRPGDWTILHVEATARTNSRKQKRKFHKFEDWGVAIMATAPPSGVRLDDRVRDQ